MKKTKFLRKNFLNSQRGITLIALVITIIVLLILAGVSLKLIAGGDGIIGKAEKAVDGYNISSAREKLELLIAEVRMEYFSDKNNENMDFLKYLKKYLEDNNIENVVLSEDGDCSFTDSNGKTYLFKIDENGEVKEKEKGITLDKTRIKLAPTETDKLQPSLIDITGEVIFESSDPSVATVSQDGTITAVNGGSATITAKVKGTDYIARCEVTVIFKITKINATDLEILKGRSLPLQVTIEPNASESEGLTFMSNDETIATVDANGIVTGIAEGKATIKVAGKISTNVTTTCTVTVVDMDIGEEAFDGLENTYYEIHPKGGTKVRKRLYIDPADYGKEITIMTSARYGKGDGCYESSMTESWNSASIWFYDVNGTKMDTGTLIAKVGGITWDETFVYTIPENSAYIEFVVSNKDLGSYMKIKEITIK